MATLFILNNQDSERDMEGTESAKNTFWEIILHLN